MQKYAFKWAMLGDIEKGRPNLGGTTTVATYRLMQYCLRDAMEKHVGAEVTDQIFQEAGMLAGAAVYNQFIAGNQELNPFLMALKDILLDLGIGIVRVEKADAETGELILTVSEDLDCSGVPETGESVCTFDEGFIKAVLESFSGRNYDVKEIDCWSTGEKTCRFRAVIIDDEA
ncbi:4-vinyl reductase [Fusibacter paucivorans]|uniref:4-vinyl reductase n=1 Tax=Fusibacter paucivorans TaxID=76009 RepID=A0ABS5PK58_9FIRM|nr:V4R domain-containing protein [Fusibacter paucivorans]MBS7525549.1 4-vinyl reductase [Fusibacter paucivorans]